MHKTHVFLVILFAGFGLLVLSFFWTSLHSSGWTEEQAKPLAEASANLHALQHARGHQMSRGHSETPGEAHEHDKGEVSEKAFNEAKEKFDKNSAALEEAIHRGESTAAWMKWIGIALVLGGAVSYYQFHAKS
jgi:hypothetical protein